MNRRTFLKGLLCSTALAALPLPMSFAKGGYVIFADVPLCEFGGMPVPQMIGEFLGSQLFPEGKMISGPRLIDLKGDRNG